jgi:hypothetical protein
MNAILASLLLLIALIVFGYAVVALIQQTDRADVKGHSAATTYNRTWAIASVLAAAGMTLLFDLRWVWIGLLSCGWLLAGWYCKWFGIPVVGEKLLHRPVDVRDWHDTTHLRDVLPRSVISRRLLILSVVWVLVSVAFVLLVSLELDREASLLQDGVITTANITDYRVSYRFSRTNSGDSYDVQYQFSLDNGASVYTSSDATGRSNLWRSIPKSEYETAITSGKIEILYLPQNPWVNRPLKSDAADLGTLLIIDLLGLASTLVAFGVSRRYVSQRLGQPPQTSQVKTM